MTRKEAIEILRHLPINIGRQPGKHLIQEAMNMAIEALETATPRPNDNLINFGDIGSPTIKPLERKRGEWIKDKNVVMGEGYVWYCSECSWARFYGFNEPMHNYCPNCSARMDERREDAEAVNTKN